MARIRAALRGQVTTHPAHAQPVAPPHVFQPDEDACLVAEAEVEIPFIEVGKNGQMEASPSVLAATPVKKIRVPAAPAPAATPTASASPTAAPGPGIVFRPVPAEAPALRPPAERFAPELIAFHQPEHATSEQYRLLVQSLRKQLSPRQSEVLLFAGATARHGAAPVAVNVAITLARQETFRVVVVDGDLDQPALAGLLGLEAAPGLADVLGGSASLQRVLQDSGVPNLFALVAGRTTSDSRLLLAGESMRAILRHLRGRFDWVLVDAPCWDGRPDVVALGSACDAVHLVAPAAEADSDTVKELLRLVPVQGARLRGCILTEN